MKIERISENQIRCTLTKIDLEERNIKITELAYGSEKAQSFFQDVMMQAEEEVGFEADNRPIMVEAVPVDKDCIILIVTKVADKNELDSRMEHLNELKKIAREARKEEYEKRSEKKQDEENLPFGPLKKIERVEDEEGDFMNIPENVRNEEKVARAKKSSEEAKKVEKLVPEITHASFVFEDITDVIDCSKRVSRDFHGQSSLYKDTETGELYLYLDKDPKKDASYSKIIAKLCEFGDLYPYDKVPKAFFVEHFMTILDGDALKTLADM